MKEVSSSSVAVSSGIDMNIIRIISNVDQSVISPFKKFIWRQQQNYLNKSSEFITILW